MTPDRLPESPSFLSRLLCRIKHRWHYHGHYLVAPQRTCKRCGKHQRKHFANPLYDCSIFGEWDRWI